ncbi:MAG: sigma-54 dependent transcriptional regulator [Myxococcota bacterium]|nr:sigma-54 dependent transcriptional regulator [Myxococcota bacterium]
MMQDMPQHNTNTHGILTNAPEMRRLFVLMERAAVTEAPVLIRGETGTGKELVAQTLHRLSTRASGPFRAVNCATLTPELLASALFGHVKGAFTGAVRSRKGLLALTNGGTLFLDEIAELPLNLQARLLRVLETQSFVPVGGTEPVRVNVRLISATHKALRRAVDAGQFRRDLMYRIRVVPLFLPRLIDRTGDISVLTNHFITQLNTTGTRTVTEIAPDCMEMLMSWSWPGNVRELKNVLQSAYILGEGPTLTHDELTPEIRGEPPPGDALSVNPLAMEEKQQLLAALREANGSRSKASALLGIHRTTLWRKLKSHRLL